MQEIILIKLGGSLITDKSKAYTAKIKVIKRLISDIKKALDKNPELNLIIGNGAGSFAHQSAKKYDTMNGFDTSEGRFAFCVVQDDAIRLNRLVVKEMLSQNMAGIGFNPSSVFIADNKRSYKNQLDVVIEMVKRKLIPVVYGDVIIDNTINSTIYSTDRVLVEIGKYLIDNNYRVKYMLSVGDYAGVMDSHNNVIENISDTNIDEITKYFYNSGKIDVTGGMSAKVNELLKLAKIGIPSVIMDGSVEDNLFNILSGDKIKATYIN